MSDRREIRVLVVDDESVIRTSLVGFLEDSDFSVRAANSGEEALEILGREDIDVAVVDLRLPGLGGEALILRAHEIRPDLRFLIHTGSAGYHPSGELAGVGVRPEHVLRKPVLDLADVTRSIEDILGDDRRVES